jgi:hypothetical protein
MINEMKNTSKKKAGSDNDWFCMQMKESRAFSIEIMKIEISMAFSQ